MKFIFLIAVLLALCVSSARAQTTQMFLNCTGNATTDTANLNAAKSRIGSLPGTIRLPWNADTSKRCKFTTITVPSNITIDNTDGIGFAADGGNTVTVQGAVINPVGKRLFYGAGAISFSGNTVVCRTGQVPVPDANGQYACAEALPNIANQSWTTSIVFSSTSNTVVSWTSGTIHTQDDHTYSINSGNTGTMAALTYIYLDIDTSTTALQVSATYTDAVGLDKILIAAAQNATGGASVIPYGGQQPIVNGGQITAGSILAAQIAANTITASKLNVSQLSAISADLGTITAGTMTGATLRTAASGARVVIDSSGIKGYDASAQRYQLLNDGSGWLARSNGIYWNSAGTLFIDGQAIVPGSVGAGAGDISLQSWSDNLTWTSTSNVRVDWSSGTITMADGTTTYSIDAGNTGTMAALTYIYLDTAVSSTVLQVTTTYSNAVGNGKILVATAQNHSAGASVIPYGGGAPIVNGSQITASSILAAQIAAGTITASKLNVSQLSAISADAGTITAGTLTGTTVRTAASGARVVLDSSGIKGYDASAQRYQLLNDGSGWLARSNGIYWTSGGTLYVDGAAVIPGSLSATGGNISLLSWSDDLAWTSSSNTQVNWSSGHIFVANGTTYTISSGNTGAMAALTYIYLDIATSTTVLQTTTSYSTAVGDGKILVATAQNATNGASVIPYGGHQPIVNGSQITASSILAAQIAAGTITASKLNVSQLSAISADLGTITAGTMTGATLRTAASGARVVIDSSGIKGYDASAQRYQLLNDGSGWLARSDGIYWTSGGTLYIDGAAILPGTIPASGSNISLQSWTTDIVFSSASNTQVNWSSGSIKTADGTTYSIVSGNTGAMAALTYIYLNIGVSSTVLQTTATYSSAVGSGRILVAAAQNGSNGASVIPYGGQQPIINGSQITALSILAGNIAAGAVTAAKISVTNLQAITAAMGALTIDDKLSLSGASSAITIGDPPPASATSGTGVWIGKYGLFAVASNVPTVNISATSGDISVAGTLYFGTSIAATGTGAASVNGSISSGGNASLASITVTTSGVNVEAGGVLVGAATGGSLGTGKINVSSDIYKNNTAYTNPAWTFQSFYTGRVDAAGPHAPGFNYAGLMPLEAHQAFTRANFELPLLTQRKDGGLFARGDLVLAELEQAYLYIYQLNERIKDLERRLGPEKK